MAGHSQTRVGQALMLRILTPGGCLGNRAIGSGQVRSFRAWPHVSLAALRDPAYVRREIFGRLQTVAQSHRKARPWRTQMAAYTYKNRDYKAEALCKSQRSWRGPSMCLSIPVLLALATLVYAQQAGGPPQIVVFVSARHVHSTHQIYAMHPH